MIKIEHLSKSYGDKQVLQDLNLSIPIPQICGLVGENGAGKTTFFECLTNLQKYTGYVNISPAIKIGYMPTSLFFYPNMQAIEYIEFYLAARKIKIQKESIDELNQLFELPLKQYAIEYSTGMKKKLALMALFLQKNDFYILDEPFNGLDLSASLLLKHLIMSLKKANKTVLISSHIILSLTDICDKIHYLKDGHIYQSYKKEEFVNIENDILSGDIKAKLEVLGKINL